MCKLLRVRGFSIFETIQKKCDVLSRTQKDDDKPRMKDHSLNCFKEAVGKLNIESPLSVEGRDADKIPTVIIVGAGISGLSAAQHLLRHGYKHENIIILEASDRIGGRIFTSWIGDAVMEMGANTIYGATTANPLYNIANLEGINVKNQSIDQVKYLSSDGRIIDDCLVQELLFQKYIEQIQCVPKSGGSGCSVFDFLSLRIQQELLHFPMETRFDTEKLLFGMVNSMKSVVGANLHNVSTQHFKLKQKLPGGDLRISQGFCTIIAQILRDIPPGCVRLNKNVNVIEWSKDIKPQVLVSCDDDIECAGHFVIVTVPLGVLKEKMIKFEPGLPESKVEAIKQIGVGYINKVFLEYMTPWWAPSEMNLRFAWSPNELKFWNSWTKGIGTLEELHNSRRVIMFTIGGKEAAEMATYSEEEIAIEFTNFIRKFTGDKTIPFPSNVAVSRWSCHPNYLGGTVFTAIGNHIGHFKNLYMPGVDSFETDLTPPVLFAGEAAHDKYFGTAHGARLSGLREAERVLKYIHAKKNSEIDFELVTNNQTSEAC